MLEGSPKTLNEHVVDRTALAVHADPGAFGHTSLAEQGRIFLTCELAALIAVDDFRLAMQGNGFSDHGRDPGGIHAVGDAPVQHIPAVQIDHRHHVDEASPYGQVGDVHGPDLIAPNDLQVAQQVGELIPGLVRHSGSRHAVHGLDAHGLHEPAHLVTADLHPSIPQFIHKAAGTPARVLHVEFVHQAHDPQVLLIHLHGLEIEAAAMDLQHFALPHDAQSLEARFHQGPSLRQGHYSSFF